MLTSDLKRVWLRQNSSEVGTAQPNSLCKYWSHSQTYIRLFSTFWYSEHIPNSYGTIKCYRSAFASCNPARAIPACLPRHGHHHIWIAADNLFCLHKDKFDEMPCKLDSAEYARSFQTNPTLPGCFFGAYLCFILGEILATHLLFKCAFCHFDIYMFLFLFLNHFTSYLHTYIKFARTHIDHWQTFVGVVSTTEAVCWSEIKDLTLFGYIHVYICTCILIFMYMNLNPIFV